MGKHRILAAASVFSGAPTLFSALHSRGLASGPRAAGGVGGAEITAPAWHRRERETRETREREINMQEGGKVTEEGAFRAALMARRRSENGGKWGKG